MDDRRKSTPAFSAVCQLQKLNRRPSWILRESKAEVNRRLSRDKPCQICKRPSRRTPWLVGRTPPVRSRPPAGFLLRFTKADEGVGRGPGGPPHQPRLLRV